MAKILVPQLFVLCINDIYNVSWIVKFIILLMIQIYNNLTELCGMLKRELKLCKWFAVNKLSVNLPKTNYHIPWYMLFRSHPPDVYINVWLSNTEITTELVNNF